MNTIKNLFLLVFVSMLGINAASFAGENDKTEIRNTKSFNSIQVSTGIDLYLKTHFTLTTH